MWHTVSILQCLFNYGDLVWAFKALGAFVLCNTNRVFIGSHQYDFIFVYNNIHVHAFTLRLLGDRHIGEVELFCVCCNWQTKFSVLVSSSYVIDVSLCFVQLGRFDLALRFARCWFCWKLNMCEVQVVFYFLSGSDSKPVSVEQRDGLMKQTNVLAMLRNQCKKLWYVVTVKDSHIKSDQNFQQI